MKLIEIRRKPSGQLHEGLFTFGDKTIQCSLGRSGISTIKREGDGATPVGDFRVLYAFYRHDRKGSIRAKIDLIPILKNFGWCDDVNNPNYNQLINLPFNARHEKMSRDDRLYDICVVLDYNIHPRKRFRGSAIFFHMTRPDRGPTEGCIAIDPKEMALLLPILDKQTVFRVHP